METLKKWLPDILAVILFAVIGFVYFMPADIDGRVLYREDSSAGRGLGQESKLYLEKTGERTRWTNSAFSGMPSPSYTSTNVLGKMENAYHLWLPENVWYVFAYLLGFYILLRAFDFKQYLAVLGSILWAFSSYFFIIIAAGHIWKVMALAYLPPMIAGLVLCYRGKYLWGLIVTAIFTAFEINANHVQMTYYYLFIILLSLHHPLHGHCLARHGHPRQEVAAVCQGLGGLCCRCSARRADQYLQSLSHLGIHQGEYAWKE